MADATSAVTIFAARFGETTKGLDKNMGIQVPVREVLETLTVPVLKDLAAIATGDDLRVKGPKSNLIDLIENSRPPDSLATLVNRIETIQPRKHCWVFSLTLATSAQPSRGQTESLFKACQRFVNDDESPEAVGGRLGIYARDALHDAIRDRVYLKLVHHIKSRNWEQTSPTTKEIREVRVRHPVTAVFRPQQAIVELRFDGYKQGLATAAEDRVPYGSVVLHCKQKLEEALGVQLAGMNLHEAISDLTATANDVEEIRRVIRPVEGGHIELDTAEGAVAKNISELVARTFRLDAKDIKDLNDALRESPTDSIVLAWNEKSILSRFSFLDIGTEILFIWRSADKSEELMDYVLNRVLSNSGQRKARAKSLLDVLGGAPNFVKRLSDLSRELSLPPEAVLKDAESFVRLGVIERCYRLKSTRLFQNYRNEWQRSLADIPETLEDEDGLQVSTLDPTAIEFGYRQKQQ